MKTTLTVEIEYDPTMTDPEGLACAMDRLLETALSTPGIMDEYGNPTFREFFVGKGAERGAAVAQSRAVKRLLRKAEEGGLDAEDLDEIVQDVAAQAASTVNNAGLAAQVAYLVEHWSAEEAEKAIDIEIEAQPKGRQA